MTKKDFVLIAATLNASCPRLSCPWDYPGSREAWIDGAMAAWSGAVRSMAEALSQTNPRFNRDTFIRACCPEGVKL